MLMYPEAPFVVFKERKIKWWNRKIDRFNNEEVLLQLVRKETFALVIVVDRKRLLNWERIKQTSGILASSLKSHWFGVRKSFPLSGGRNTSSLYPTGNPSSWRLDSRVHKPDGSPPDVTTLPPRRERTEIRLSRSQDFEEEKVWRAFTEFDLPGKVIRAEWDPSSSLDENMRQP